MNSWRDTASDEAQQTLDDLFDTALQLAVQDVGLGEFGLAEGQRRLW